LLTDLSEEKFLANSMNSLTQQQWQEIVMQHFFFGEFSHFGDNLFGIFFNVIRK
jgi:hypothetical protein